MPFETLRALFIAAGQGLRLGPQGRELPKGLLPIGDTTLMERAIGLLRHAGVTDITIVTGHLHEQYDALAHRLGQNVRTVFNPAYASYGASRSLAVGLEAAESPTLMLESDVVWEQRALDAMLGHPAESSLLISGPTGAGDEVWAWESEHRGRATLSALSKERAFRPRPPFGELVGIIRIGPLLRARLLREIKRAEATEPFVPYETCMTKAAADVPLELLRIDDLVWGEIDDASMYRRVRENVWPSIEALEKRS